MRALFILILITFYTNSLLSQDFGCGTELTEESEVFFYGFEKILRNKNVSARNNSTTISVPLQFFIIRRANGTGGLSASRLGPLVNELNILYDNAGIEFFQPEPVEFVDSDVFFNLDQSEETNIAVSRDKPGVINIYISSTLTSGGTPLCGYTRFPPSVDRIFLAVGCVDNEVGTTAHELGHYFTLFHTHGKTNNGTTDELVAREGCEVLGDNLCDTPADPNLSGLVSGCTYVGNLLDGNGVPFVPEPRNIMSYAPNFCRDFFSQGQYDRIRLGLENGRSYLNIVFQNFSARFTSDNRSGCAPLEVNYSDITSGGSTREWFFEGGNINSSLSPTPKVIYSSPGRFDVGLTATNSSGGTSNVFRTNFITVLDKFRNVVENVEETFLETLLPEKWSIENNDQLETFTISTTSLDNNSNSLFIDNLNYTPEVLPQIDAVEFPNINLIETKSIDINFSYAYTYRTAIVDDILNVIGSDTLEIGYKLDCSEEFFALMSLGGDQLATTDPFDELFIPNGEEDWSKIELTINKDDISLQFDDLEVFRPVIRNKNGNGNALYIDRVEVEPDFSLDSIEFFRVSESAPEIITLRWSNPAINELGVIIERSNDGTNFITIDSVNRNVSVFEDDDLPESWTKLYYRVLNYNSKANSSYSKIVEVNNNTVTSIFENKTFSKGGNIKLYPNPGQKGLFYLRLNCIEAEHLTNISVLNTQGKLVKELVKEKNLFFSRESNLIEMNLFDLKPGVYILSLNGHQSCLNQSIKLIIN